MFRTRTHTVLDTPLGPLTIVGEDGAVCGVFFDDQRHAPPPTAVGDPAPGGFAAATEQLEAYFAGELRDFDLPLSPTGTPFQLRVWAALREIPYGETRSYGQVAATLGLPGGSRAVGLANGRNPIGIVVPCHRVIGANGSLTGYGGGIERKRALLELEAGRLHLAV